MTEVPDAPITGLDVSHIGELLVKLPAVAAYLRHKTIKGTLTYVHAIPGDEEAQFVRDLLTLPLDALLDKWYGGRFRAAGMAADAMDLAYQDRVS